MYVTLSGLCAAMLFGGKGISFTYTKGVFIAFVIQQAIRSFVIIVLQSAPLYSMFHNVSQTARFTNYNLLNLKCVFWLSLHIWSDTFLILRRLDRDIIINLKCVHIKYKLFLSGCYESWILEKIARKFEIFNFIKIPPVGSYLLHGERRTEGETDKRRDKHDEANCRFFEFWENI